MAQFHGFVSYVVEKEVGGSQKRSEEDLQERSWLTLEGNATRKSLYRMARHLLSFPDGGRWKECQTVMPKAHDKRKDYYLCAEAEVQSESDKCFHRMNREGKKEKTQLGIRSTK